MATTHHQEAQTDSDLLQLTAAGNTEAFETLYKKFEHRLYQYLRVMTNNDSLAEEVLIDVMVAVWQGAKNFQGTSQVSTWIFGIARHKGVDAVRSLIKSETRSQELHENTELVDAKQNPLEQTEVASAGSLVRKAIGSLSPEHQEVIYLTFFEGLSYLEIAELTGCPVNTVKTRVFYAKQKLKGSLETFGFSDEDL